MAAAERNTEGPLPFGGEFASKGPVESGGG